MNALDLDTYLRKFRKRHPIYRSSFTARFGWQYFGTGDRNHMTAIWDSPQAARIDRKRAAIKAWKLEQEPHRIRALQAGELF